MVEFEKLWMYLKHSGHKTANISIANCPDDWKRGHIVLSTHDNEHHGFAHVFLESVELDAIIEALQKVREDMK